MIREVQVRRPDAEERLGQHFGHRVFISEQPKHVAFLKCFCPPVGGGVSGSWRPPGPPASSGRARPASKRTSDPMQIRLAKIARESRSPPPWPGPVDGSRFPPAPPAPRRPPSLDPPAPKAFPPICRQGSPPPTPPARRCKMRRHPRRPQSGKPAARDDYGGYRSCDHRSHRRLIRWVGYFLLMRVASLISRYVPPANPRIAPITTPQGSQ